MTTLAMNAFDPCCLLNHTLFEARDHVLLIFVSLGMCLTHGEEALVTVDEN